MNTKAETETNPFTKTPQKQLSRRTFSKGAVTAGIAIAAMPLVPSALKASTVANLQTSTSLREVIAAQLLKFDSKTSLVSAAQDEAFHMHLSRQLLNLHPATIS